MVELLVVLAIMTIAITGIFNMLGSARSTFFNADAAIDLRNSLRQASERISLEMRNTGYQGGTARFTILDGQGTGGSDIIRFSIPVICTSSGTLLDATGSPAYWGAPLTWGCDSSSCMDANDDCSTLEYKYVQYSLNASNQLERAVLDTALTTVNNSTTIMGQNIVDLQASAVGDQITFTLSGQKVSAVRKTLTLNFTNKVFINNFGG